MKRIGIIGAMEIEVEELKKRMEVKAVNKIAGMEFCEGHYGNNEVIIVRSGIGKVNAAICTQLLADRYGAEMVINTGIAGGLYKDINIGDIVIATEALQHDMDATGFGYAKGVIPQMPTSVFKADDNLEKKLWRYAKMQTRIFLYMRAVCSAGIVLCRTMKRKKSCGIYLKATVPRWRGQPLPRLRI